MTQYGTSNSGYANGQHNTPDGPGKDSLAHPILDVDTSQARHPVRLVATDGSAFVDRHAPAPARTSAATDPSCAPILAA